MESEHSVTIRKLIVSSNFGTASVTKVLCKLAYTACRFAKFFFLPDTAPNFTLNSFAENSMLQKEMIAT